MKTPFLIGSRHILHVFLTHHQYTKEEYRNPVNSVRRVSDWPDVVPVTSGYVHENQLFLSETIVQEADFSRADVLLLREKAPRSLILENKRRAIEMFTLRWQESQLWLSLQYTGALHLGYPARENFDLLPLPLHKPVRICINGRTWHSLTGRRAHTYHEWDFIFDYAGVFDQATILPHIHQLRKLSVADIKQIDLRKVLY